MRTGGCNSSRLRARLTLHCFEFIDRVNRNLSNSIFGMPKRAFLALLLSIFAVPALGQQFPPKPAGGAIAEITATGPQRREGPVYIADKDVDIHYLGMRLQADHVEYNTDTYQAIARGHVIFDYENQHLEGDEVQLNVDSGRGTFHNVRGEIRIQRQPNPVLLVSDNPLYFEAQTVERFGEDYYEIYHSWFTICEPKKPTWQFYAPEAKLTVGKTVAMVNANFRLFRVPLFWSPFATAPAGSHLRQSGFLLPIIGNSNTKGFTIGDSFYWAPTPWMDATAGFEYFGKRGPAERVSFRATPVEGTAIHYSFFGVQDREDQGGYEQQLEIQSLWNHGWRFVTDLNQLSSLTFRLAFAGTYGEAVNSEIRSSVFLTNNFHGFSFNAVGLNDRSYLEISPQTSVVLRDAPEARFSSVEQAPWKNLPIYLSFTSFAGAVYRDDSYISTTDFVPRAEFAPRVTIPFHFGQWLGVTTSATFRTTFYGDSFNASGDVSGQSITRNTGEFLVELRPATLERFFDRPASRHRYKHTIEPVINYFYVTGVNNFQNFIRFDSNATLTDTNEIEYGVIQHLYVKHGDEQPVDFLSWSLIQKHYFDSTFGGAIVTGQRNVFQALDSVTPFAFAATPRNWSPIVSDVKLTPGGRYDAESIIEYDPQLNKITTIGTLLKVKPYSEFFATVADFRLQGNPIVEQPSHQIRGIIGYGDIARPGFNISAGVNYDILQDTLLNQFVQVSYNGSCCGLSVEYGRFNLANVRSENQFRVALILANIGTFGNLRKLEKIF